MSTTFRKKAILLLIFPVLLIQIDTTCTLSSLAKNDVFPMFTSLDPHTFLLMHERLKYRDPDWAKAKGYHAGITISPFAQNADNGKTLKGEAKFNQDGGTITSLDTLVPLSDLTGRTSMLALIYGELPAGKSYGILLTDARKNIFGVMDDEEEIKVIDECQGNKIDPAQNFAYFSFPFTYRKRGIRFEFNVKFFRNLGLTIQTGISNIRQTVIERIDRTNETPAEQEPFPDSNLDNAIMVNDLKKPSSITKKQVQDYLMRRLDNIAQEIGLNICNFHKASIEEARFLLYWRNAYELNRRKEDWPHFLIIPFLQFGGSVSPGRKKDPSIFFEAPFGNNGHHAVGLTGGLNFDFIESIEIGGEIGFTHFFDRDFRDFRVPNSEFQSNFFPFMTDVTVKPGHNWHFGGKIASYHFLDNLSMYFQYLVIEHLEDRITLKKEDSAFMPKELEKKTCWKTKIANIAFNYDISPNTSLGFLWQAPLSQRNTYRSTTILFSFSATF